MKQKHKVIRKVKEHHKKKAKEAKKLGFNKKPKVEKDPGIPNDWPFKEQELKALEARRARVIEDLEQKKAARKERVGPWISYLLWLWVELICCGPLVLLCCLSFVAYFGFFPENIGARAFLEYGYGLIRPRMEREIFILSIMFVFTSANYVQVVSLSCRCCCLHVLMCFEFSLAN